MPMIDVYAAEGTFADPHALARNLATELMTIEQVPDIPMFRKNTAAFVHALPASALANVDGDSSYVPGRPHLGPAHRGSRRRLGPGGPREHERRADRRGAGTARRAQGEHAAWLTVPSCVEQISGWRVPPEIRIRSLSLSQPLRELGSRGHVQLAKRLAQVVLDRARADEELRGDLAVRVALGREA